MVTPRPPTEKVYYYHTIDSTNAQAQRLADSEQAPEWTVVVADIQTQGHGRKGRVWLSPLGGLWFSVVLRPRLPAQESSILQFYAANCTRRVIERFAQKNCGVKWPNDLILDGKKVGGILVETRVSGDELVYAILGIGVNLNVPGRLLPESATSLLESTGRHVDRENVWHGMVAELQAAYPLFGNPAAVVSDWWANCVHKNKPVELDMPDSSRVSGLNVGIDAHGRLKVQLQNARLVEVSEGTLRAML